MSGASVEQMVQRHSYLYDDRTCVEALEAFYRRVVHEVNQQPQRRVNE